MSTDTQGAVPLIQPYRGLRLGLSSGSYRRCSLSRKGATLRFQKVELTFRTAAVSVEDGLRRSARRVLSAWLNFSILSEQKSIAVFACRNSGRRPFGARRRRSPEVSGSCSYHLAQLMIWL